MIVFKRHSVWFGSCGSDFTISKPKTNQNFITFKTLYKNSNLLVILCSFACSNIQKSKNHNFVLFFEEKIGV